MERTDASSGHHNTVRSICGIADIEFGVFFGRQTDNRIIPLNQHVAQHFLFSGQSSFPETDDDRKSDIDTYRRILDQADAHHYLAQSYYNGLMQARNRALVDGADTCVAFLRTSRGGTAYTFAYALKNGLETINLHDRL